MTFNQSQIGRVLLLLALLGCKGKEDQSGKEATLAAVCKQNFERAAAQYKYMAGLLPEDRFPRSFENGEMVTGGSGWWCSGFYPGTLWYIYEQTGHTALLKEAVRAQKELAKEQFNTTTHDLGFMMFCSFGNAYRVTANDEYLDVIKNSAASLASRFNPTVGCIRSWDVGPWQYPVIIDNMMNLEMLLWSAGQFALPTFSSIAKAHADKTMAHHFRDDFSSYHVVSYDTVTGNPERKQTNQGYADQSAWARGQVWGLYGYTTMYRFTKDDKYLDQARKIAGFILNHSNLPEDKIPYWDFDAPDIPNAYRDASAAAIMASALLELQGYVDNKTSDLYIAVAESILRTLSGSHYFAEPESNGGFLIRHCVGNMPKNSEIDTPLSYADYYFVEAMKRYLDIVNDNFSSGERAIPGMVK